MAMPAWGWSIRSRQGVSVVLVSYIALAAATRITPVQQAKNASAPGTVALPNLRPKPWTTPPPYVPTSAAPLAQPCNTSLHTVEELPKEEPVITYRHAWMTFWFVLATALLWLLLAFITMHGSKAREPLLVASAHDRSGSPVSSSLENATRALITAAVQASWTDFTTGMCGCFKDFPGFIFTLCCPCARWADNIQRIHILDYTHAKWIALGASTIALMAVLIWVAVSLYLATHTEVNGLHDTLLTFLGVSLASGVASIFWFAFGGLFTYYRQESRRKLSIWRPDSWEADFLSSCCCWPLAIAQETRHIDTAAKEGYKVRESKTLMSLHPILGGKRDSNAQGDAAGRK